MGTGNQDFGRAIFREPKNFTLYYAVRLANAYQGYGKYKKARKVVDHIRQTFDRESPQLDILEGTLLLAEQRNKKALNLFKKAESEAGDLPDIYLRIAHAYLQLNKFDEAEKAVKKELALDEERVGAWHTLGIIYFKKTEYEYALESFLKAIGLMYYYPASHFYLGETLMAIERYEDAADAFEVCLQLVPGLNVARKRLIAIYEQFLDQPGKAYKYKTDFDNKIDGEIIIVSGLPRSGTSMMMQMLEAGGLDIFTDIEREADDSNPKGYYEHELVKSLAKNKKWLPDAKDKAVKVIAQLLQHLPPKYRYKVIFMERNLYEVIQSQQKMLKRAGKKVKEDELPVALLDSYQKTLTNVKSWVDKQANVDILNLEHAEIIDNPFLATMKVHDFLGRDLELEKMAACVDGKLYRERVKNPVQ